MQPVALHSATGGMIDLRACCMIAPDDDEADEGSTPPPDLPPQAT